MHGQASLLDAEPRKPDPAREFVFVHRVFGAPGAYFKRDERSGEPVLSVDLGDIKAVLGFETLRRSFGIAADSSDGRMLEAVARGLAYVRRIRPGDAIPAELLDGSASWRVEPRHVAVAKGRIAAGLLAWIGAGSFVHGAEALATFAEAPAAMRKLREAYDRLARHLDLPAERHAEAVEMADALAEELAYVEALRERVALMRACVEAFKRLRNAYKRDRNVLDQIERTIRLLEIPVASYEDRLAAVDARIADAAAAIVDLAASVDFIREIRDLLHAETMRWDDLLALWDHAEPARSPAEQRKIAATCRFAARHFPVASEWSTD